MANLHLFTTHENHDFAFYKISQMGLREVQETKHKLTVKETDPSLMALALSFAQEWEIAHGIEGNFKWEVINED